MLLSTRSWDAELQQGKSGQPGDENESRHAGGERERGREGRAGSARAGISLVDPSWPACHLRTPLSTSPSGTTMTRPLDIELKQLRLSEGPPN